jgi:sulfatase modifying factor 1
MALVRIGRALAAAVVLASAAVHCGTILETEPGGPTTPGLDAGPRPPGDGEPLEAAIPDDDGGAADGGPQTTVMITVPPSGAIPAFTIDRTEVTQAQYAEFIARGGVPVEAKDARCGKRSFAPNTGPYDPVGNPDLPVVGVDWCDATLYCRWAGKRLCGAHGGDGGVRAEVVNAARSEWFAACSRSGTRAYPYGNVAEPGSCTIAAADASAIVPVGGRSTCEGGYPGLRDMVGNASEWVNMCDADGCAIVGGSYRFGAGNVSCALATHTGPGASFDDLGFRCCR